MKFLITILSLALLNIPLFCQGLSDVNREIILSHIDESIFPIIKSLNKKSNGNNLILGFEVDNYGLISNSGLYDRTNPKLNEFTDLSEIVVSPNNEIMGYSNTVGYKVYVVLSDGFEKLRLNDNCNSMFISKNGFGVLSDRAILKECDLENYPESEKVNCTSSKFIDYIMSNIKYSPSAIEHKISGTTILDFGIDIDGKMFAIKCFRDLGHGICDSIISVVEELQKNDVIWFPAKNKIGYPSKTTFTLPIPINVN